MNILVIFQLFPSLLKIQLYSLSSSNQVIVLLEKKKDVLM